MRLIQRYNQYFNNKCVDSVSSIEHLQATSIRAALYAFRRKYGMRDNIPVDELNELADLIESQGNESIVPTQKVAQGHSRKDLDAL